MMELLKQHQLHANLSKCVFVVDQISYLGHTISGEGVSIDHSKIAAVADWPVPTTPTQLRGFLGLCGYYRRFVHNFGAIARPLHDVLKKDNFTWTTAQTEAFKLLNRL